MAKQNWFKKLKEHRQNKTAQYNPDIQDILDANPEGAPRFSLDEREEAATASMSNDEYNDWVKNADVYVKKAKIKREAQSETPSEKPLASGNDSGNHIATAINNTQAAKGNVTPYSWERPLQYTSQTASTLKSYFPTGSIAMLLFVILFIIFAIAPTTTGNGDKYTRLVLMWKAMTNGLEFASTAANYTNGQSNGPLFNVLLLSLFVGAFPTVIVSWNS